MGSTRRERCRVACPGSHSSYHLDYRASLDGSGLHPECKDTGPYYLAMIAPVFLLAAGIGSAGFSGWLILGVLILAGSKIIC